MHRKMGKLTTLTPEGKGINWQKAHTITTARTRLVHSHTARPAPPSLWPRQPRPATSTRTSIGSRGATPASGRAGQVHA